MEGRLVVRVAFWARSPSGLILGFTGFILAVGAPGTGSSGEKALLMIGAGILTGFGVLTVLRPRLILDAGGMTSTGVFASKEVRWDRVVAVSWVESNSSKTGVGWIPVLHRAGGRSTSEGKIPEHRIFDVNEWLREHQPGIRIDPKPPWRDRFGAWHVAEPGYDPVETMRSIRRSLVGPWEVAARSCEGGFRARQVRVHSGEVVAESPVRATLREAIDDGVVLVREAVAAAGSATE